MTSSWEWWCLKSPKGWFRCLPSVLRSSDRGTSAKITGVSIVYSTVCSGADQRKNQSSASLAFVRGIHQWPVFDVTVCERASYADERAGYTESVFICWRHHEEMALKRCIVSGHKITGQMESRSQCEQTSDRLLSIVRADFIGMKLTLQMSVPCISWWRHQMETLPALLALCAGNSPVTAEFPT